MNLLEHYIKEVYSVKKIDMDGGWSFINVDMMINCYGREQRVQDTFSNMEEWEKVIETKRTSKNTAINTK